MADGQSPQPLPPPTSKGAPTPSPPALDTVESETHLSRKREREVSLEPGTPSATEIDAIPRDRKDSRTPAKKHRRHLDTTLEEEDEGSRSRSHSVTPPMGVSPPQEMKIKVRQISQGVEDLSWRNMQAPQEHKDEDMASSGEGHDSNDERAMEVSQTQPVEPSPSADAQAQGAEADKQEAVSGEQATAHDEDGHSPPVTPEDAGLSKSVPDLVSIQPAAQSNEQGGEDVSASRLRAYSESGEKGIKRKFLERGTSQGPPEAAEQAKEPSGEALKRPRDEAEQDDNPRETKRVSPPPEPKSPQRTSPPSPKVPKLGGFMAYASTSSPFASVKGKNLFAKSGSTSSLSLSSTPSVTTAALGSKLGESSSQGTLSSGFGAFAGASSPFASVASRAKSPVLEDSARPSSPKRSGFEAFSSAASPFASVTRAKSPTLGSTSKLGRAKSPPRSSSSFTSNPFASYATGAQGFGAPTPKRPRAGSPSGGSSRSSLERTDTIPVFGQENGGDDSDVKPTQSFSERLRAGKEDEEEAEEDENKVSLTEQEVLTGEEEEETLMQVRGKLFALDGNQWKERGTGIMRLNVKSEDGSNPRLVMRKDAVYTLLLNVILFPGMRCALAQDPRYLRFSVIEEGKTTHYNLRLANAKIAQDFLDEIKSNIPA